VTRGRVSASVYRSPRRHLDLYRISYHYTLHIYPLALVCNSISLLHTSADKCRRTSFTLYSIFQLSDTFRSRGYPSFTPIVKERHNREKTNSLRVNFTVNRLLCLLRKLPEINCAGLVDVRARKTYDSSVELPLYSPDESPCFRSMQSATRVITMTKKTLPSDGDHAKDDGRTSIRSWYP